MAASMLEVAVRRVLPGFTLDVEFRTKERIVALIGPSGAGKSLTLKAIAGALPLDSGRIVCDGQELYDAEQGIDVPPQQRGVGYVPQSYALFPHLTVEQNISFGLKRTSSESVPSPLRGEGQGEGDVD